MKLVNPEKRKHSKSCDRTLDYSNHGPTAHISVAGFLKVSWFNVNLGHMPLNYVNISLFNH
jgi:hypothetical protein